MTRLSLLLLASQQAFSGEAALQHARALSALGPHTFGSPRAQFAAAYVAAKFRENGLQEVQLAPFEAEGLKGQNVIGTLRGPGPEFLVLAAHHDSAPDAPGAYDDGGGIGVLIEVARLLALRQERQRTLVFVSFDGEESESQRKTATAGSRAYVQSLGAEARNLVAALAVDMCGQKDGAPVLHPIAYPDPLRPGESVIAPAWLVREALAGAKDGGQAFDLGDPLLGLLYQPAVRAFRVRLYADDLSFLQAGLPAVFVSDSSFTRFYPAYHAPGDTADKLDPLALERTGRAVLGALERLSRVPLSRAAEPTWFSAFGLVIPGVAVYSVALASLLPSLVRLSRCKGLAWFLSVGHMTAFAVLLWRFPLPAVFVYGLPNLIVPFVPDRRSLLSLLPGVALGGLGAAAALRHPGGAPPIVAGMWLQAWALLLLVLGLVALWFVRPGPPGPVWKRAAAPRKRRAAR
jgi:hypothetical protein